MDLIFDVQVLPHRRSAELPEPVLASIAGYYRAGSPAEQSHLALDLSRSSAVPGRHVRFPPAVVTAH
ncbi:hypothetical protein JOF57_002122 [Mycolicibacterium lutetiense]|uniref:Uncharacterized protein n=1 Tax=Mycolicibacterium lutetiense TaxID=1641992 RepID=A0ABS4ZRV3_9MYCO|nr:hypothetical protein [Mycolicibacterium lutetiense]